MFYMVPAVNIRKIARADQELRFGTGPVDDGQIGAVFQQLLYFYRFIGVIRQIAVGVDFERRVRQVQAAAKGVSFAVVFLVGFDSHSISEVRGELLKLGDAVVGASVADEKDGPILVIGDESGEPIHGRAKERRCVKRRQNKR